MDLRELNSSHCSIARTASIIGDRWTVLILRDLFNGVTRFDQLCSHLGIARDVLTTRLGRLLAAGLIDRREYREGAGRARQEYVLTTAGRDLRVVLVALMDFGDGHLASEDGPPMSLRHRDCGAAVHASLRCEAGHDIATDDRTELVALAGARRATTTA